MTNDDALAYQIMRRYAYRCEAIEDIAADLGKGVREVQAIIDGHSKTYAKAVRDNPDAVTGDALVKLKVQYERLQSFLDVSIREGIEELTRVEKETDEDGHVDKLAPLKERKVTTRNQSDPVRIAREMRETLRDYLAIALRDSGTSMRNDPLSTLHSPMNGLSNDLLRDTIKSLSRHIGNVVTLPRGIENGRN